MKETVLSQRTAVLIVSK